MEMPVPYCIYTRKKKMFGQLKLDVRKKLSTLCKYKGEEIIEGAVCADHVHMYVSIPPKMSISNFMGYLKGKSTLMIYDRYSEQRKWNKAFWARGYYVATVGNVTEDAIKIHSGTVRRVPEGRKWRSRFLAAASSICLRHPSFRRAVIEPLGAFLHHLKWGI